MQRRILITGCNRGLGLELTRQLLERGEQVLATARQRSPDDALELLQRQYEARRQQDDTAGKLEIFYLELGSEQSLNELLRSLEQEGVHALHGLVMNAGIYPEPERSPVESSSAALQSAFDVHVRSNHELLQRLLPLLQAGSQELSPACVVAVSSRLASFGAIEAGELSADTNLSYQTSKAALNMLCLSWAKALEHSAIKLNAVSPGWCATDMGGAQAPRTPEQGAASLLPFLFLADDGPHGAFMDDEGRIAW